MDIEQVAPPRTSKTKPPRPSPKPKAEAPEAIDPAIKSALVLAAAIAIANGETSDIPDDHGRSWTISPDVVGAHSVVLIQARLGLASAYRNISTAVLGVSTQPAADAITAICAELS